MARTTTGTRKPRLPKKKIETPAGPEVMEERPIEESALIAEETIEVAEVELNEISEPAEVVTQEEVQEIPPESDRPVEEMRIEESAPVLDVVLEVEEKKASPAPKKRGGRKRTPKSLVTQASTRFGWMEVNGVRHEHDVIIHPDGTVSKRDKKLSRDKKDKYGHVPLTRKELLFIADEKPKLIFIGTGQSGGMPLTPKASKMLEELGAVVKPTPDLIEDILNAKEKFVAIIHVTC